MPAIRIATPLLAALLALAVACGGESKPAAAPTATPPPATATPAPRPSPTATPPPATPTVAPLPSPTATSQAVVPLPTEEDIIRVFFALIDEDRPTEAVDMMTADLRGNDASRQQWAVQFNAIDSIKVTSILPFDKEGWSAARHEYRVQLSVQMKAAAARATIPNYGWDNGPNVRWVIIEKVGTLWRIAGIGTGP